MTTWAFREKTEQVYLASSPMIRGELSDCILKTAWDLQDHGRDRKHSVWLPIPPPSLKLRKLNAIQSLLCLTISRFGPKTLAFSNRRDFLAIDF